MFRHKRTKERNAYVMSSGPQEGPGRRGHVKKRQKLSKCVKMCQKKNFDTFRHFSGMAKCVSKIVKRCQTYFQHYLTIFAQHQFSGPLGGGSDMSICPCSMLPSCARRAERCLIAITSSVAAVGQWLALTQVSITPPILRC